jgi:GT2 family glycosyltransferase
MDVSVIIVNYNTKNLIKQCIESIVKFTVGIQYEIIIVDNASIDGSQKMIKENFPFVSLIENELNLGFGSANNIGANYAQGKYLFFLNSDCLLIENTIKSFFEFAEINNKEKNIGAIGALLYDNDMKLNISYHRFPNTIAVFLNSFGPIFRKFNYQTPYKVNSHNYNHSKKYNEVDFITGADMFILKEIFNNLEGFDEQFFLYYEESDLQKRMESVGLKRIILKDQKIVHLEGFSSKKSHVPLKTTLIMRDSRYKYFKKHLSKISYIIFYLVLTPLQISPLFSKSYTYNQKKEWLKMLCRKKINLQNI